MGDVVDQTFEVVDVGAVQNHDLFRIHIDRTNSTLILCHVQNLSDGLFRIVDWGGGLLEIFFILHHSLNQVFYFVLDDLYAVSLILDAAASIVETFDGFERVQEYIDEIYWRKGSHFDPILIEVNHSQKVTHFLVIQRYSKIPDDVSFENHDKFCSVAMLSHRFEYLSIIQLYLFYHILCIWCLNVYL